jgi:hypothetical protein
LREIGELPRSADGAKMAVVIDQAPRHMTVDVPTAARRMSMDLIPVPPGGTGRRQPMDVRVFGVLKRKQSKLYDNAMRECPGRARTKADSVRTITTHGPKSVPMLSRAGGYTPAVRPSDSGWSVSPGPVKGWFGSANAMVLLPLVWFSVEAAWRCPDARGRRDWHASWPGLSGRWDMMLEGPSFLAFPLRPRAGSCRA